RAHMVVCRVSAVGHCVFACYRSVQLLDRHSSRRRRSGNDSTKRTHTKAWSSFVVLIPLNRDRRLIIALDHLVGRDPSSGALVPSAIRSCSLCPCVRRDAEATPFNT